MKSLSNLNAAIASAIWSGDFQDSKLVSCFTTSDVDVEVILSNDNKNSRFKITVSEIVQDKREYNSSPSIFVGDMFNSPPDGLTIKESLELNFDFFEPTNMFAGKISKDRTCLMLYANDDGNYYPTQTFHISRTKDLISVLQQAEEHFKLKKMKG